LVGWLSGFRAQTGSVAYCSYATFVRRLGEAAVPGGGECGPCHEFASNTLAFALQLRKSTENLSQGKLMTEVENVGVFIQVKVWHEKSLRQSDGV